MALGGGVCSGRVKTVGGMWWDGGGGKETNDMAAIEPVLLNLGHHGPRCHHW